MPDTFDERFSGLPVDAPSAPLISDIVGNAQIASPQFNLVPVDYNPFPKRRKRPAAFNDEPPTEMIRPDAPVADKMFGLNGKERYQFFPERLARSVYDIMSGQVAPYNPSTGEYNVEGAMDVAGLLGGAPLGMKPGTASLGSGAVRPIMNANKNEVAKPFFSAVEKAVTDISQPKMTGQQWLGTLSNKPGVKPEELDWIGLKDYLKENADKVVTKQEIESHVAANKVELKDVDKGQSQYFQPTYKDTLPRRLEIFPTSVLNEINTVKDVVAAKTHNVNFRETVKGKTDEEILNAVKEAKNIPNFDHILKRYDTRAEAEAAIKNANASNHLDIKDNVDFSDTKYQSYQLPGGENYREKLLTLPEKQHQAVTDFNKFKQQLELKYNTHMDSAYDAAKITGDKSIGIKYQQLLQEAQQVQGYQGMNYKSSHWDEPNVLAHVRMNDRTMNGEGFAVRNKVSGNTSQVFPTEEAAKAYAAKNFPENYHSKLEYVSANRPVKSLHIEEIQSDWHQQGRQHGYKSDDSIIKRQAEIEKRLDEMIKNKKEGDTSIEHMRKLDANPEYFKLREELFNNQKAEYAEKNALPDAPFKKTWHELALKRMLREAAEKGYDRLSWTPGEAQAARYDLSKHVDTLSTSGPDKNGKYLVYIEGKDKQPLFRNQNGFSDHGQKAMTAKELENTVGKEVAKKATEGAAKNKNNEKTNGFFDLKDEGLKIGGEGMKGFYDQIIPKSIERITKGHDVKVKTTKIGDNQVHYIDLPQSLKDIAMHKGFPLFSGSFMLTPINHNPFTENEK